MKDYNRDEIIPLAEQIYIHTMLEKYTLTNEHTKEHAKKAIRAAMLFREAELELWEEQI